MEIEEQITAALRKIEHDEDMRVLYACELGSRAWGFASTDSDWDVRFVSVRPRDWYLSFDIEEKREVIERPITADLDISGWDLRKALGLLRKSNPPLLEWLQSPIVYREVPEFTARLRDLVSVCYSPIACGYHYLRMAENNYRAYLRGDTVSRKKYLYVLRPLLALQWIEENRGVPPILFEELVKMLVTDARVQQEIAALVAAKKAGGEIGRAPRNPILSDFIAQELARRKTVHADPPPQKPSREPLNALFRWAVQHLPPPPE